MVLAPNGGESWNSLETIKWTPSSDQSNQTFDTGITGTSQSSIRTDTFGQTFLAEANLWEIKEASMWVGMGVGANPLSGKLQLLAMNANGTIGQLLAEAAVTIPAALTKITLPNLSVVLQAGTSAILQFKPGSSGLFEFRPDWTQDSPYKQGNMYYGTSKMDGYGMHIEVKYAEGTPQSALKYQIQLSSNNGSTWKDIVALSAPGISSLAYDFINETESATSKIRIRAYDGFIYGDWDESDGVFTILHNQAPTKPTNLKPNGTIEDRATAIRMSWQHNDPNNNDPQSKYEIQWRPQGSANWNNWSQTTPNNYYDMSTNAFPAGIIEWRVRTFDQAGFAGPYSEVVTFTAAVRTVTPTITYPTVNAVVPIARPTFTWSHPSQVKYWLRVKNMSSAVVYEEQKASTNRAVTIAYDLANNTDYTAELAIMDANGLWSTFASNAFKVSYTSPMKPNVTPVVDNENGHIQLNIDSPDVIGTTPKTAYYDVFRKDDNGNWATMTSGIDPNGEAYARPFSFNSDFKGKVAGSTVANPNIGKRTAYAGVGNTRLITPTEFAIENEQDVYSRIATLDGISSGPTIATNDAISQQLFSFNIVELLERNLGAQIWGGKTAIADKVAIAREITTTLVGSWWGFGTGARGGGASFTCWISANNSWYYNPGLLFSATTPMRRDFTPGNWAPTYLTADGFMHYLAYAEKAERKNILPNLNAASSWADNYNVYSNRTASNIHIKPTATFQECTQLIDVRPNTKYAANANSTSDKLMYIVTYLNDAGTSLGQTVEKRGWQEFTTPANCVKVRFRLSNWAVVEGDFTDIYMVLSPDDGNRDSIVPSTINTDYVQITLSGTAKGTTAYWTDYTPKPNKDEYYFVRAYGSNGTFTDSDIISAKAQLSHVQLALASDPTKFVTMMKRESGKSTTGRSAVTNDFVGRPYPLTEFGNNLSREHDYTYKIEDYESVLTIQDFAQMGEAFILRDNWGMKDFVTFHSVDVQESRYFWYASLQPTKIYYVEGIL
ncbi:hypothetical protein ACQKOA_26435 [Bacillus mobilis]|uniref:hypothetical protein n=1 Tax=Bacillus mobilis TaxID=2026190 RepID=UPI003D03F073